MWAQRVMARKGSAAHVILEVKADASAEEAQETFHKVARACHPDLHRNGLNAEDLELVTSAYATVAGAYHTLRSHAMQTTRMKPLNPEGGSGPQVGPPGASSKVPVTPSGPAPTGHASQSMSPKALVYYRKAELSLKRGDLKGALLQIKLAIASDPASAFLRTALAEVELEFRKGT
jgi:hypothetical protein